MKKKYKTPQAEKVSFDYTETVVASGGGGGGKPDGSKYCGCCYHIPKPVVPCKPKWHPFIFWFC